jgi:hypothetical protein
MYQQLLIREDLAASPAGKKAFRSQNLEQSWAWIYLQAQDLARKASSTSQGLGVVQLLPGVPFLLALLALQDRGLLVTDLSLPLREPQALERELHALGYTPRGHLAVPLRVLSVLPTPSALFDTLAAQYTIGFSFAIDATVDRWMHDAAAQQRSAFVLPAPPAGSPRLATHAAVITALDMEAQEVTVQNSFGPSFGIMGFFYIPLTLLLRPDFTELRFHILVRSG